MSNDAKLGMLAGVCGVIVAAVVLGQPQPQSQPVTAPPATAEAKEQAPPPPAAEPTTTTTHEQPAPGPTSAPDLPSTPVVRTKKDVEGQPASRQPEMEEK